MHSNFFMLINFHLRIPFNRVFEVLLLRRKAFLLNFGSFNSICLRSQRQIVLILLNLLKPNLRYYFLVGIEIALEKQVMNHFLWNLVSVGLWLLFKVYLRRKSMSFVYFTLKLTKSISCSSLGVYCCKH